MSRSGGAYHVPLRLPLYGKMSPALGHEPHRRQVEGADPLLRGQRRDHPLQRPAGQAGRHQQHGALGGLRELEGDGLVRRQAYPEVPVRVEYSATERCMRLLPVLESLSDWAEAEMDGPEEKFPE